MSTQPYEDPFEGVPDDQLSDDELAQRRRANAAGFQHRQQSKRERDLETELNETKAKLSKLERQDALTGATRELNAQGPLGAFLRNYDGEPTPGAIRQAVANDPDFSPLVTFPPDPRDVAAQEQATNATRLAGGQAPALGELTAKTVGSWPKDKQIMFMTQHRDVWDRLSSFPDEAVAAPAGWA